MRFLTDVEGHKWVADQGLPAPLDEPVAFGFLHESSFKIPGQATRQTAIAHEIARWFCAQGETLLWVTGWGFWGTSENPQLFALVRKYFGENRPLIDVPCHIAQATEPASLEALLDLVFYFGWDAMLSNPNRGALVKLSNDEVLDVYGKDVADFIEIDFLLKEWKLEAT